MNIVKTESICLSQSEAETFKKMAHILDELIKNCEEIVHRKTAEDARNKLCAVWGLIDEIETGDDCE